jgi:hypothetical protein
MRPNERNGRICRHQCGKIIIALIVGCMPPDVVAGSRETLI